MQEIPNPETMLRENPDTLAPDVLWSCAKKAPWTALELDHVRRRLTPEQVAWLAIVWPSGGLQHAANILPRNILITCARRAPEAALEYAADTLPQRIRDLCVRKIARKRVIVARLNDIADIKAWMTERGASLHHSAWRRGYVGVNCGAIYTYSGRYGDGYVVYVPNLRTQPHRSTQYHVVQYYIREPVCSDDILATEIPHYAAGEPSYE